MQITPVQINNTTAVNTQNQLYSQIAGLKNKDPKANAAQIAQLTVQLNSSLGQTEQSTTPVVQVTPVEAKSPIKTQSSPTGSSTGTIVDAKA